MQYEWLQDTHSAILVAQGYIECMQGINFYPNFFFFLQLRQQEFNCKLIELLKTMLVKEQNHAAF